MYAPEVAHQPVVSVRRIDPSCIFERMPMTACPNDADHVPAPPVAMPRWPGPRNADAIERTLRQLRPPCRDALLDALAHALDRHLVAGAQRFGGARDELEERLDEVLRRLGPLAVRRLPLFDGVSG